MEKIKTPIMAQIEIEKKRLDEASIAYHRADSNKDGLGMQLAKNKMIESAHCLSVLKSILPAERDAMVDFAQNYKSYCFESSTFPDSAGTYFTQTFKSYE